MSTDFFSQCEVLDTIEATEHYLKNYFLKRRPAIDDLSPQLFEAIEYSVFSGGKRFRPVLSVLVEPKAMAFAAAIEMVHTYSLIHDDLPCMDNDDFRRGKWTTHKKYGEALALLAGDALLTESFLAISEAYRSQPQVVCELVQILAQASGASGMVGGQAMDMAMGSPLNQAQAVEKVHLTKTAALIAAAVEGAAVVQGGSVVRRQALKEVGLLLGHCFQMKDDLLDGDQDQSPKSYLHFMSHEQLQNKLQRETKMGLEKLIAFTGKEKVYLENFFHYNQQRQK